MILGPAFPYGCAYYPEHWDRKLWARDARLMRRAGFNIVRVGEFAWYFFEPRDGEFHFEWLDDALTVLAKEGIRAILGTPTATIPAWLGQKYPHVMAIHDGVRRRPFGIRKDYCIIQPDFERLAFRVTGELARHYAKDPRIAGFQIDNELSSCRCRCPDCLQSFRGFLRRRYKTIDRLNKEYGTWFWGAVYNSFDEIYFPAADYPNPGHGLDLRRWASYVDIDHAAKQAAILRKLAPGKPITSNLMGLFSGIDYFELGESLDFVSYDTYPGTNTGGRIHNEALTSAVMWAIKRQNYVVMEQQSGPGGWCAHGPQADPGETAMLAWSSVAHGGDGVLYFRWRTCTAGQEQYWGGILSHDNVPRRRYHEIAAMGKQLKKLAPRILGTKPVADVGLYYNYDQIWATDYDAQCAHNPARFGAVLREMAGGLTPLGVSYGCFGHPGPRNSPRNGDLRGYKLVMCPLLYLTDPVLAKDLTGYARAGGHLVLTARSGVKTINALNVMRILPGAFADLAGVEVEENCILPPPSELPEGQWLIELVGPASAGGGASGGTIRPQRVRELLRPRKGVEVMGVHRGGYMEGAPAITRHKLGKGVVWYIGTLPNEADWGILLQRILPAAGGTFRGDLPHGVELARRTGKGGELTFVLNHTAKPQVVNHPRAAKDLITGKTINGSLPLAAYQVAVLVEK